MDDRFSGRRSIAGSLYLFGTKLYLERYTTGSPIAGEGICDRALVCGSRQDAE
jgi:hypothetical protein